jgi:2-hydroxychromene-2-carboxylate isomerase
MATYEQVITALRAADAAGNVEDARRLAAIASNMRAAQQVAPRTTPPAVEYTAEQMAPATPEDMGFSGNAPTETEKLVGRTALGIGKGLVNPALAAAQLIPAARPTVENIQRSYQEARANLGGEGFDVPELVGSIVNPINRLIPMGGAAGSVAARGALGGAIGAATQPLVGENLNTEQILAGKVEQLGLGAIVGRGASALASALTPTLKAGTRELLESGVPVTPGQAYEGMGGALFRQIEKLDIPTMRVDKDKINLGFTKAVGNEILAIVDDKLPPKLTNGQQIFGYLQNKLTSYYDDALNKIGKVSPDEQFTKNLTELQTTLRNELGDPKQVKSFQNFLKANIVNRINLKDGKFDAQDLKRMEEIFRTKIDSIKATDTTADILRQGYDDAYKAIKNLIIRNDKDGSIAKANLAYMQRSRVMEAVNKNVAEISGAQGTFSPAELARAAARQGGDIEAAMGTAPLQQTATRALNVVGDTTDEATKFRNVMIAGKLAGLGALGFFSPAIAVPILTASGMSYKAAQALMKEPSKLRLAVQEALKANPGLFGVGLSNIRSQQAEVE